MPDDGYVSWSTSTSTESLLAVFMAKCQEKTIGLEINNNINKQNFTVISQALKLEMNGLEGTQENCPSIMSILTQLERVTTYTKVLCTIVYTQLSSWTFCEICQLFLSILRMTFC